jgi:hypothetical protein
MTKIAVTFRDGAQNDLDNWDCNKMYPKPKPVDLGVPGWLGGLTKAATQGFKIYNVVKQFIPSKAGAGKVPGSPKKEEEFEFDLEETMKMPKMPKVDWKNAKAQGAKLGMKLLDDMEKA